MVALVHSERFIGGSANYTPSVAPTPGNLLVLSCATRNSGLGPSSITGWTILSPGVQTTDVGPSFARDHAMFYRVAQSGDATFFWTGSNTIFSYAEFSGVGALLSSVGDRVLWGVSNDSVCGGDITTSQAALIVGGEASNAGDTAVWGVDPTSPNIELDDLAGLGAGPAFWMAYRVESAAGTYAVNGTVASGSTGGPPSHVGITAAFAIDQAPVADFGWDASGFSVNFIDTSTNNPTSWSWTFGDGSTSTSQDPIHVYGSPGSYSVTLTVSNAHGSDSVTKTVTVTVTVETPDGAGKATVEIYVHDPEGFKWDEATWDDAEWAASGWQDVTPQSIDVLIRWGVADASLGILSVPDADSWAINFLDPGRKLDPANIESPFYGDLAPFLPVRVNLDGYTVRTGIAEAIGHDWVAPRLDETGDVIPGTGLDGGYMRVTNNIARMANATVPHDTELSNTLVARAVDALAACGLSDITVLPLASDPALVAWTDTGTDQTAWDWLKESCQQVLYQPYIDRHNQLGFREYLAPLIRVTELTDADMTALASIVNYQSNYSVVTAGAETRALTPTPIYGKRTFKRDTTPDDATWAQAVLDDRSLTSLRWIPGETYTTTPLRSHELADVRAVEVITLRNDSTDPPVLADVIVLGGQIRISARSMDTAQWWFTYEAAQTAELPLAVDGSDPVEYITTEGGVDFLYAD